MSNVSPVRTDVPSLQAGFLIPTLIRYTMLPAAKQCPQYASKGALRSSWFYAMLKCFWAYTPDSRQDHIGND